MTWPPNLTKFHHVLNPGNTIRQNARRDRLRHPESRLCRITVQSCVWVGREHTVLGKVFMQQEPLGAGSAEPSGYVFYFQFASNGTRRACSLTIQADSANEAAKIFRENWITIEEMAREGVSTGTIDSATVVLAAN
ncbi:hypothetical protein [Bradyrhizobium genosp. P]|uniref:hypothetical protein n=1 Tax=Bradyrhizobium genosp. P TaxID=83641 RepID=UPI003CF21F36